MSDWQTGGYIKLHRGLLDHRLWQLSPGTLKMALAFLLKANRKETVWFDGVENVVIPRGSFITSITKMAEFCTLSRDQTRDAWRHIANTHFATHRSTQRWTMVTICDFDSYCAPFQEDPTAHPIGDPTAHPIVKPTDTPQHTPTTREKDLKQIHGQTEGLTGHPAWLQIKTPFEETQWGWFREVWPGYWRKVSKKEAWIAFRKTVTRRDRFQQVVAAIRMQSAEMLKRDLSNRPHLATWINGERWEDETEDPKVVKREVPEWVDPYAGFGVNQ